MTVIAYLDAGSGSVILQALLAGAAGVSVALKMYWGRIKRLFGRSDEPSDARAAEARADD